MKKIINLHIGTPKTATSFLQSLFVINDSLLRKSGILYPVTGRYEAGDKHLHLHHNVAAAVNGVYAPKQKLRLLRKGLVGNKAFQGIKAKILEEINAFDGDTVLISCENFWKLDTKQIRILSEIFGGHRVKIVAYLRRQDLFLESRSTNLTLIPTVEQYKHRTLDPNSSYRRDCNYSQILGRWAKVFGRDNMQVRIFQESAMINGHVVDDFFSNFSNVSISGLVFPERKNESLTRDGLEIKAMLNGIFYDATLPNPLQPAQKYIPVIADFVRSKKLPKWPLFCQSERQQIITAYRQTNAAVDSAYFGKGGYLFDEEDLNQYADETSIYPGLSADTLGEFFEYLNLHDRELFVELIYNIKRFVQGINFSPHTSELKSSKTNGIKNAVFGLPGRILKIRS